jgi:predicted DNA-binding transcriptional regulator AlpA
VQANPSLKLHQNQAPKQDPPGSVTATVPTFAPLLIPAETAGPLCGRSEASWWRDHAAGRNPAPVRLGGRTLWRVEELRQWVEAGCPDRRTWEALRAAQSNGRRA